MDRSKRGRTRIASQVERKQKMIAEYERLAKELADKPEKAKYFRKCRRPGQTSVNWLDEVDTISHFPSFAK